MKKSLYKDFSKIPLEKRDKIYDHLKRIHGDELKPEEWPEGLWELFFDGLESHAKKKGWI